MEAGPLDATLFVQRAKRAGEANQVEISLSELCSDRGWQLPGWIEVLERPGFGLADTN